MGAGARAVCDTCEQVKPISSVTTCGWNFYMSAPARDGVSMQHAGTSQTFVAQSLWMTLQQAQETLSFAGFELGLPCC